MAVFSPTRPPAPAAAPPPAAAADELPPGLGGRAFLAVIAATIGLALIAGSFALSRQGDDGAAPRVLFWAGLAAVVMPAAVSLLSRRASRSDRILLVTATGLFGYAAKVLHDPTQFVISDEFTHLSAAQQLTDAHALYQSQPLAGLNAAAGYPGLHAVTAALHEVTSLSLFASGVLVIAAARIVLMIALYLLVERVTGSSRVAGVAALLYAADANFLFWMSQLSYESLSLPLFVAAVFAVISRPADRRGPWLALTACAVILGAAIIPTHHLTSYAFAALLWLLTLASLATGERSARMPYLATFATAGAALWFSLVATGTRPYLEVVFRRTYDAIADVASGGTRKPFESAGLSTPPLEQALAFVAVALVCAGLLLGLRALWRRSAVDGRPPMATATALLVGASGCVFLLGYPLKLFPGAWETANRAADFLFIGVAILLAVAVVRLADGGRWPGRRRAALAVLAAVAVCGGVSQGWPAKLLLSQPLTVKTSSGDVIAPQSAADARWLVSHLPHGSRYVADETSGRWLAVDGAQTVFGGRSTGVPEMLKQARLAGWQRSLLVRKGVDYVVVDQRKISANNLAGYFFASGERPDGGVGYYPAAVREKFSDLPRSSRILDSGDIVVYDVSNLHTPAPRCKDVLSPGADQVVSCRTRSALLSFAGADRTVTYPGMQIRVLSSRIDRRQEGLVVNVLIQAKNTGREVYAPDPDGEHLYLSIGDFKVVPARRDPERRDNFNGRTPVRVGGTRPGNLRFVLSGAQARRFIRAGGDLGIARPNTLDPVRLGVVHIPSTRIAP
jgi:hypothetical protein